MSPKETEKTGITAAELARLFEISSQAVVKWRHAGCPVEPGGRTFRVASVVAWMLERERARLDEAMAAGESRDRWQAARASKVEYEARLAGIALAEKEGTLLPDHVLRGVVGEFCDNLRAVLVNVPANYVVDLERVGVPPKEAEGVLQRIAEDLTAALRDAATGEEHPGTEEAT